MSKHTRTHTDSVDRLATGVALEIDTLELTRRGRQEQARVMAALLAAGMKRLAEFGRKIVQLARAPSLTRMGHSLKGN